MNGDGILWYGIGMMFGLAIGTTTLNEEISWNLPDETKDAAKSGNVSAAMNCAALADLQQSLNEIYASKAKGDVEPSQFSFSEEDCLSMAAPKAGAQP